MTIPLKIYESATPVSFQRHGSWSVEKVTDYSFCRTLNAVPLMGAEFAKAALEYAVVFAGDDEMVMPAAVLGVRPDQNLYVDESGAWQARYIPAFIRRYPFVFGSAQEESTFTLCIDDSFAGFNQAGRGERLFSDDGRPSSYIEKVLQFQQGYQRDFEITRALCRKLKELNLLHSMHAQTELVTGERVGLSAFWVVDRPRLKTLSPAVLADLVQTDATETIYAHLISMGNFASITDRLLRASHPGEAVQ